MDIKDNSNHNNMMNPSSLWTSQQLQNEWQCMMDGDESNSNSHDNLSPIISYLDPQIASNRHSSLSTTNINDNMSSKLSHLTHVIGIYFNHIS